MHSTQGVTDMLLIALSNMHSTQGVTDMSADSTKQQQAYPQGRPYPQCKGR